LALINTGEADSSADTFRIELFNGSSGTKVAMVDGVTVGALGWKQIGMILAQYAPGTSQGYARITRTAGNNPFIAYGVVNDGGQPGERTADKELMTAIRHILTFLLRTVSVIAIIWLAFLAAQIVSRRFAWSFLHRFLGPPF
jgi:hypothetical protein